MFIGPRLPIPPPAPPKVIQAIKSIEITNSDEGRDGFEITFGAGRSGPADLFDYEIIKNPLIKKGNRVIMQAFMGFMPKVLIDGIITLRQFDTGSGPGQTTLKVTGEDIIHVMDRQEITAQWPQQPDNTIVNTILAQYMQYGFVTETRVSGPLEVPTVFDRMPTQSASDKAYLQVLAENNGAVFYTELGDVIGVNKIYWGPPRRIGEKQSPLYVNMGPDTNVVGNVNIQDNSLGLTRYDGSIIDRQTGMIVPVTTVPSTRPPLSMRPEWATNPDARTMQYRGDGGVSITQATAQAQGQSDASTDTITATGEIDSVRYGNILRARRLVEVHGAGEEHDGKYYVKKVVHKIKRGEYKQSFELTRDGAGPIP